VDYSRTLRKARKPGTAGYFDPLIYCRLTAGADGARKQAVSAKYGLDALPSENYLNYRAWKN
jgi:hypothetical protein